MHRRIPFALLVATTLCATPAIAQIAAPNEAGFSPRVPVSGLARPSLGIDPSRFHVSTSVAFGSYDSRVAGLQVTSFSYDFRQPLTLNVRVGNAWGGGGQRGFSNTSAFFLEGLDMTFRPSSSFIIHVGYQDVRSPLQNTGLNPYAPYGVRGY